MNRSQKQRMLAGELYDPLDPELQADLAQARNWLHNYNRAPISEESHRMLTARFAFVGRGAVVRAPFYCDYGYNISLGQDAFLNFNCVVLDVVAVMIGEGTQIGPAVQIYTADHPRNAATRRRGLEFGRPVRIGRHVWIGGGAIILPGVTIGDEAIIGAGSVVTRDVPAGAMAVGNPGRTRPVRG